MPPVAKTRIPAAWAAIIVADTVVAAQPPSARATASEGRAALRTVPAGAVASASRSAATQPDQQPALVHGHRRRDGATLADRGLGGTGDVEVLGVRQPVADEGRLEGDHGAALGQGGLDLGGDEQARAEVRDGHRGRVPPVAPEATAARQVATLTPMATRARRPMTPADIAQQVVVEELDLAGDGRLAIVVRRAIRRSRYVSHLVAIPIDGRGIGKPRALTSGPVRDAKPRISPDGRTIAFVRSDPFDDDAPSRLGLLSVRDGRVSFRVRRGHGAVGELAWSPDGSRLAFTAEVDPPRTLVGDVVSVDRTSKDAPARSPGHPDRLALGRGRPSRPLVAPVRARYGHSSIRGPTGDRR